MVSRNHVRPHPDLIPRLQRAEGQVRALKHMIERGAPSADVLIQLAAARGALDRIGLLIIEAHLRDVMTELRNPDARDARIDECCSVIRYATR
jgi:CsoR family transcriptional regulator, copper-sensing transcriptional repressor